MPTDDPARSAPSAWLDLWPPPPPPPLSPVTAEDLRQQYKDKGWSIWVSGVGRFWSQRLLTVAEHSAGCQATLQADTVEDLADQLYSQELLRHRLTLAVQMALRTPTSRHEEIAFRAGDLS